MGWTHTRGAGKKEIIAEIEASFASGCELVAKRCVGNHFWTVVRTPEREPFIVLFLLRSDRHYGWGYKDMDESMHPYYYTCPEKFLDIAPERCEEWRDKVLEYHARRKRKLEIGATYALPGCRPDRVTLDSLRPLRGYGSDGRYYRISKSRLGDKLEDAPGVEK